MKVYLSIKDENEIEKIKETIETIEKCKILDKDDLKSLKKASTVICSDADVEKIKAFYLLKKNVIVFKKNSKLPESISYLKNIYTYNSKNELSEIIYDIKNNSKKSSVFASIIVVFIVGILFAISSTKVLKKETQKTTEDKTQVVEKEKKVEKTDENNEKEIQDIKKENYVFLGDSITYFYNLGMFYPDLPVINSGIGGYQTQDIIDHLQDFVYRYNPTKVFLLIGTNDIEFSDYTDEELADRITYIVKQIKKHRPRTKIYVESIYPVNRETDNDVVDISMVRGRNNERIQKINSLIEEMCSEENNVEYINMYDELTDENGNLNLEYTRDGLHTNDNGYEVITKKIMTYIEKVENN